MSTLAEDLKTCRKRLNISLEDISKNTRVPVSLFASMEDGTFFSDPGFTRTYIRSFTRMYGKAIKIDEVDIVRALDEDEAEMYSGFLHRKYVLGEVEKPIVVPPIPVQRESVTKPDTASPAQTATLAATIRPEPPRTPIESDRTVDWADMNAKINRPRPNSNSTLYLVIALLLVLVAAATIYLWYNPLGANSNANNEPQSQIETTPPVVEPSDQVALEPPPELTQLQNLPDTLTLIVYALYDKLDPVRIVSDLKNGVNPYWIEKGAGREFEFRDTIVVRADASRFALIYNGHLINSMGEFRFDEDSLNYRLTRGVLLQRPETQSRGSLPDNVRPPILDF